MDGLNHIRWTDSTTRGTKDGQTESHTGYKIKGLNHSWHISWTGYSQDDGSGLENR